MPRPRTPSGLTELAVPARANSPRLPLPAWLSLDPPTSNIKTFFHSPPPFIPHPPSTPPSRDPAIFFPKSHIQKRGRKSVLKRLPSTKHIVRHGLRKKFQPHSRNETKQSHNKAGNMATTAMDYENANGDRYEGQLDTRIDLLMRPRPISPGDLTRYGADDGPRYERDQRSASPRPMRDDGPDSRRRSASPNGNADRYAQPT